MMQRTVRALFLVAVVAVVAHGRAAPEQPDRAVASTAKPAWLWTDEERLTERFDPAEIQLRRGEAATPDPSKVTVSTDSKATERNDNVITIDGRLHPQLLMPHELFDGLMTGFVPDVDRRARQRSAFLPGIRALGFDEELFWAELASVTSGHVQNLYGAEADEVAFKITCRSAHDALAAARLQFGRDRFDNLLYTVVAPVTWTSSAASGLADAAAELRRRAGGCR